MALKEIFEKEIEHVDSKKLNSPVSIHGMPGMGMSGKNAVDILINTLPNVRKIHEIYSTAFPSHVVILEDGSIKPPKIEIYLHKSEGEHDLVLVTGDIQPNNPISTNNLSQFIINFLHRLGTTQVISLAATPVTSPKDTPRVFMTATSDDLIPPLRKIGVKPFVRGIITGMNGTVPALAKLKHDVDGIILLSETYPQFIEDTKASVSLLKILQAYLNIKISQKSLDNLEDKGNNNIKIFKRMKENRRSPSKRKRGNLGYIS